jgi:hypothetical protein
VLLAVVAGERLAGLELGAGLGIVEYDRYELLGGLSMMLIETGSSCFSGRWIINFIPAVVIQRS